MSAAAVWTPGDEGLTLFLGRVSSTPSRRRLALLEAPTDQPRERAYDAETDRLRALIRQDPPAPSWVDGFDRYLASYEVRLHRRMDTYGGRDWTETDPPAGQLTPDRQLTIALAATERRTA